MTSIDSRRKTGTLTIRPYLSNVNLGGSWCFNRLWSCRPDPKTFSNDNPLRHSKRKAHSIGIFLPESFVNKSLGLAPIDEAKLRDPIFGQQSSEQLLQRTILGVGGRCRIWLRLVSVAVKIMQIHKAQDSHASSSYTTHL